ncbi:hypothetical protein BVU42_09710 [Klebsiella pneumoniae]|nr:hypothetical protein BVU42_09710 [Klebsiella pneumoniae]
MAVADQLIVDLSFAFQADTGIGGIVATGVAIGGPDVLADHFSIEVQGNDSNLLIVFYVQIMPDDFVMQLHRF